MRLAIEGGAPVAKDPFPVWPSFDPAVFDVVQRPLQSGQVNYWTGTVGRAFEEKFADYCGARFAISVTNGTAALHTALSALGVGPGDEVICPAYTFIATAFAVLQAGAMPVFADVDASHTLDPKGLEGLISDRTRAIIVVHTFGVAADMDPILALARRQNLLVIEDCAQATGGAYKGRKLGTLGDAGCFSFCQSKHFTTGGEGGAIVVNDEAAAWSCRSFRDHGFDVAQRLELLELEKRFNYVHPNVGFNFRMTEMQSEIGLCELARFERWNLPNRRRNGAHLSKRMLPHPAVVAGPLDSDDRQNAFWWAPFTLDMQSLLVPINQIVEAIAAEGVPITTVPWPEIYKEQVFTQRKGFGAKNYPFDDPAARDIDYVGVVCDAAKSLGSSTVAIPVHPVYDIAHMDLCVKAFEKVVSHYAV